MKLLLVGLGRYGAKYIAHLLERNDPSATLAGIVEPRFETCPIRDRIQEAGIPVYETMEAFFAADRADLTIICTPSFLHAKQSEVALAHGSYVLCEKPVAPTVAEAEAMAAAEKRYGKWIAIGYQWSYSQAIRQVKRDILEGMLGEPISFRTAISWPRDRAYYSRGSWVGKISLNGIPVFDSIASNACAHYLHNMLFLLGDRMNSSAEVTALEGDCLRVNPIENFDTCSLRLRTDGNVPVYFVASHAAQEKRNPEFEYRFEKATLQYSERDGGEIVALFSDGSVKKYGDPFADIFEKVWICLDAIREGTTPICTVETATPHTKLIEMLQRKLPIVTVPAKWIRVNEQTGALYAEGLFESMYEAYARGALLSEQAPELFKEEA